MGVDRGGARVALGLLAGVLAVAAVAWALRVSPPLPGPVRARVAASPAGDDDEGDDYGRDFAGGMPYTGDDGHDGPRGTDVRSSAA